MAAPGGTGKGSLLTTLAARPEHLGHQEWCQAFMADKASDWEQDYALIMRANVQLPFLEQSAFPSVSHLNCFH